MHVALSLLTLFPGRVGGSETYVRGLLGEFAAGRGPERVTVLANRHVAAAYGDLARGSVALHEVRSYRAGDGLLTRALAMAGARVAPRRVARDVPASIDVVHHAVTVPIPRLAVPSVVTVHDVSHLDGRRPAAWPLRAYRSWAYDGAARAASTVVATSRFAAERIVDGMRVAPERVEVVPLGIDHDLFRPGPLPDDDAVLRGIQLPDRFLFYPANLWPHKNHERLVDALARSDDPELSLVLAGQPYGRWERLRRHANRARLAERVVHLGHRDPRVMAALYRRAAATVIPSLHEGFGLPALEAMACGCPVATSGCGALADLTAGAIDFDPRDPESIAAVVSRLLQDEGLRSDLVQAGRCLAAAYTWQACARHHAELYAAAARRR